MVPVISTAPSPAPSRPGEAPVDPVERGAPRHLIEVLRQLRAHGIELALVRPPGRDGAGRVEADVLVRPSQRAEVERLLAADGFRRRPGWGRRPHRFHVRPVLDGGHHELDWLKLDLVTDLCFGPLHELATDTGEACLDARGADARRSATLAPADELAALLLHGLLDRGQLRPDQRRRLAALAPRAGEPGPLGRRCLAPGVGPARWSDLLAMIEARDWEGVLGTAPALRAELARGRRVAVARRRLGNAVARHSTKLLTATRGRGALVAIVGPDGAGKTTLVGRLPAEAGVPCRAAYGGTHPEGTRRSVLPGGTTARIALGLLGTRARVAWHRGRGRLVVLDRHPLQVRPRPGSGLPLRTRARRHLLAATLPTPDLLVVLDAPATVLHGRRPEHAVARLEQDRLTHLALVERDRPSVVLDVTRSPVEVFHDVVQVIWRVALGPGPTAVAEGRR